MGLQTNIGGGSAPLTTDIKTGMFTIPAGQHALVKCLSASDSTFTVDSGSGAVVAEELTTFLSSQNSSGSQVGLSLNTPTTVDNSVWNCFLTFCCESARDVQVTIGSNSSTSSIQSYNKLLLEASTQDATVNKFHNQVPSGGSSRATVTAVPFQLKDNGLLYFMDVTDFTLLNVYSWNFIAERVRTGSMYESIVPEGTILNGDRYSVTLYSN